MKSSFPDTHVNIDAHIEALRFLRTRGRMLSALASLPRPVAAKSEISTQIERLGALLAQKQRPEVLAIGLSVVRADPAKVISRLRREGVLRASRYEYRAGALRELVQLGNGVRSTFPGCP